MASANVDLNIDVMEELPLKVVRRREAVATRRYEALEVLPNNKRPLHDLLRKQPAVLGSLQMVSGLLSVGVGIVFAVSQDMSKTLFTLFRVPQMTGMLFVIAGLISNMLCKYPELLSVSLMVNCGCLCVAFVSAPLIIVDLAKSTISTNPQDVIKVELFELCILVLESCLSAVLCFWFAKEKRKLSI